VLRGVFAAVFSSEGVGFDEEAGSFAMNRTFNGDMALTGEGNLARWTRRALERAGYRVRTGPEQCETLVTVTAVGDRATWDLSRNGCVQSHASIEKLLATIKTGEIRNPR